MTAEDQPELTDEMLWARASRGDKRAFETLYKRHWQTLLDDAYRRLKVRQEAEEVVQDIFVSLYNRRASLEIRDNLAGYLHRSVQLAVYNKIRSYITQRNYRRLEALRLEGVAEDVLATAEYRELNDALQHTIRRLPEKCRQVFLLSREQGLGYRQIALELNISPNTVERHINKALKVLRQEFGTMDAAPLLVVALTAGLLA